VRHERLLVGQRVFVARPVGNLADGQARLVVAQRHRHGGLVHDRLHVEGGGGGLARRQGQAPDRAVVGLLLDVEHGHAEVAVVVGVQVVGVREVAAVAAEAVEKAEAAFAVAGPDVGRVHHPGDGQALEALVGEVVLQRLGLDRDAVELGRLLGRHAPLRLVRLGRRVDLGLGGLELGLQRLDLGPQLAQLLQDGVVRLRQGREGGRQGQHQHGGTHGATDQRHGCSLLG